MLRYLQIVASVICFTASVLLIALWVRSYWSMDGISGPTPNGLGFQVSSTHGWIVCSEGSPAGPTWNNPWEVSLGGESSLEGPEAGNFILRGFDIVREPCVTRICIPHWFPVLLFATLAATAWIQWSQRFSLRTLLIAMTLVAVGLGVFAASR